MLRLFIAAVAIWSATCVAVDAKLSNCLELQAESRFRLEWQIMEDGKSVDM
jgi:hypothetical protein